MPLVLKQLGKRYGTGVHAVREIDLEVRDGEFFTLLGPSGCGKTTTLRMIAGLERPTSGRIVIGERDFTDVPPNKGVYRGQGQETISVRVETRELPRLPALSWQEQLPPLQVPLTAIRGRLREEAGSDQAAPQQ